MVSKQSKYLKLVFAVMGFMFLPLLSHGQIEFMSGIDLSYPLLLNSNNTKPNYGQITFGIKAGVAYKPTNTQFFPILTFAYGRTRLPLKQFGQNVAALNFNYTNLMLNENFIVHFTKSELFIYGGIGFSSLANKGLTIAGPGGETMNSQIDSTANINKTFPAMNLGFEYIYGESTGKDLYLGMGLNFQYILLLNDRNTYDISVHQMGGITNSYHVNLTGNVISPGFYICVHYLIHIKKKNSYYL